MIFFYNTGTGTRHCRRWKLEEKKNCWKKSVNQAASMEARDRDFRSRVCIRTKMELQSSRNNRGETGKENFVKVMPLNSQCSYMWRHQLMMKEPRAKNKQLEELIKPSFICGSKAWLTFAIKMLNQSCFRFQHQQSRVSTRLLHCKLFSRHFHFVEVLLQALSENQQVITHSTVHDRNKPCDPQCLCRTGFQV